jgi:uncharacterized membrane protein
MTDKKKVGDDLNDMIDDAKEKTKEFAKEAKETASDIAEDAKQVLSDGKNVAIIAHITLIGWIIALVMNNNDKNELASFYIRQMLGLMIIGILLSFIPIVGWVLNLGILAFWIISLLGAFEGKEKLIPLLGIQFQDWFKSL